MQIGKIYKRIFAIAMVAAMLLRTTSDIVYADLAETATVSGGDVLSTESVSDGDASGQEAVAGESAPENQDSEDEILDEDLLASLLMMNAMTFALPYAGDETFMTLEEMLVQAEAAGIKNFQKQDNGAVLSSLTLPNDPIEAGKLLVLLSHTEPSVYQGAEITIVSNVDLTQEVEGLTYVGLGREVAPYAGALKANAGISPVITLSYPLFEAVSQDATNSAGGSPIELYFTYEYDETIGYVPIFAEKVCAGAAGGDMTEWNFHVNNFGRIYGMINELSGTRGIKVNLSVHKPDTSEETTLVVQPSDDHYAGLICSTMKAEAKMVINSVVVDAGITDVLVSATGWNRAGGLVGMIEPVTKLELPNGMVWESCNLSVATESSHAGGLVGEIQQFGQVTIPENQTVSGNINIISTGGGCVGVVAGYCLVGVVDIYDLFSGSPQITVTSASGNAGVLVGHAAGATFKLNNGWKVPSAGSYTVSGRNVGELAGEGDNVTLNLGSGKKVSVGNPVLLKASGTGNVGGIIGNYKLSATETNKLGAVINGDTYAVEQINIDDSAGDKYVYCGGLFGSLNVQDGAGVSVSNLSITTGSKMYQTGYNSVLGGIAGRIYDDGDYADADTRALTAIMVKDVTVTLDLLKDNRHSELLAGLVGVLGDAAKGNGIYLEVATEKNQMNHIYIPHAHAGNNGFGGVISKVEKKCVVNLENIAVSNKLEGGFWHGPDGAGLIAIVSYGSAVRLGGTIDLSDMYFWHNKDRGSATGQLIGLQESSLIYADKDLQLIRAEFISGVWNLDKSGNRRLSDIGNYGGVVRKSDFIVLDATTHRVSISDPVIYNGSVTLSSVDDFVKLAIAMQSFGHFAGVQGVTPDNCAGLYSSDINLAADIDLTGTGVYSLTRDTQVSGVHYTGNFQGQGGVKTLTLATGEKWGQYEVNDGVTVDCSTLDMDGMGQIYSNNVRGIIPNSHNRLGVFGDVFGPATFKDISLAGTMEFGSNMKGTVVNPPDCREDVYVGGLVAYADGRNGRIVFENITNQLSMTFGNEEFGTISPDLSRVGGLAGGLDNVSYMDIKNYVGKVSMSYTKPNDYVKLGGVIAEIHWVDNEVVVEDTVLSDNIQYNMKVGSSSAYAMYGGGLIGFLYGNTTYTVTLDGVQVKGQTIEGNVASGNAGGLLGYHWERANVIFAGDETQSGAGLNVVKSDTGENNILRIKNDSSVKVALGSLCYEASGYWRVERHGISLKDLEIENAYGTMGLVLNRGYIGDQGLYLELTDAESYEVDGATVQITKAENKEFDELIYDTTGGDQNRGGVISIATEGHELIDLPSGERNTYINQTQFNGTEEWNTVDARSRYYYNLDKYRAETELSGTLDTPEKVLLWSTYCYARDNIRKFFWSDTSGNYTISNEIDLTGYSYYPVRLEGSLTLSPGTTLVLNNQAIEEKEGVAAPALRRSTWETSQHYRMHFGLLREITGSLYVGEKNSALPVTLMGNVGAENNYGGFLVNSQFGSGVKDNKKKLQLYHVVLEDAYINGYDGSSVRPLLINSVDNYVDVDIKTLYTQTAENEAGQYENTNGDASWYAASSLIGRVGSDNGTEIALNFEDIRLDGRAEKGEKIEAYDTYRSIFSRATLLESFSYADQSSYGVYNFVKAEDWNDDGIAIHHVTYGKELSESVRNVDLQYQYYGEPYAVDAKNYENTDVENMHRFETGYLPYVACGEADYKHEIDVNVKIYHLLEGCGTYGHPYSITQAGEIQTMADFLNSGLAKKGWIIGYNQDRDFCKGNSEYDKYYKYNGTEWEACDIDGSLLSSGTLTNEQVLDYLSAAYYSMDADITMFKKFAGIGTDDRPFHGVFVNNSQGKEDGKRYTLTVTTEGGIQMSGLVSVSDGCVVKDIKIHFEPKKKNFTLSGNADIYFGGVIGKVVRGDSVIDGVNVSYAGDIQINQHYLDRKVTIGSLVGVVKSGGVVLRNITDSGIRMTEEGKISSGASVEGDKTYNKNYSYLNCNPYVGKVADGYVISQGCAVDNGDKNYKISEFMPKETKEATLSAVADSVYPVEISGGDGLFAFSLIMSCGAASSHEEVGYVKTFRGRGEADYSKVGNGQLTAEDSEYLASTRDDAVDGTSYIIRGFTEGDRSQWKTLNSQQISVEFTADCDVTGFGNSFRGIGYRDNYSTQDGCKVILAGANAVTGLKADGTVARITYAMDTKEHTNGRAFKTSGLFNRVYTSANAVLHDLRICGSVLMDTYEDSGYRNNSVNDESLAGGGLVGIIHSGSGTRVQNVYIGGEESDSFTIGKAAEDGDTPHGISLYSVGGAVGLALENPLTLQDCVIENSSITAPYCVGGLVGVGGAYVNWNGIGLNILYSKNTLMQNVTLTANGDNGYVSAVGGLVALAHSGVSVGTASEEYAVTLQGIRFTRNAGTTNDEVYVGGALGLVERNNGDMNAAIATVSSVVVRDAYLGDGPTVAYQEALIGEEYYGVSRASVGGIVGGIKDRNINLTNCHFQSGIIIAGKNAGGLCGWINKLDTARDARSYIIKDCSVAVGVDNQVNLMGFTACGGALGWIQMYNAILEVKGLRLGTESGRYLGYVKGTESGKTLHCAGGVIGCHNASKALLEDVRVENMTLVASRSVGGLVGYMNNVGHTFQTTDTSVKANRLINTGNRNNKEVSSSVGGMLGGTNSVVKLIECSNILLENNQLYHLSDETTNDTWRNWLTDDLSATSAPTGTVGVLCMGNIAGQIHNEAKIKFVGLTVQECTIQGEEKPLQEVGSSGYTGYIVYADYLGACRERAKNSLPGEYPFVYTSPYNESFLKVYESIGAEAIQLYGDGVAMADNKSLAQIIYQQSPNQQIKAGITEDRLTLYNTAENTTGTDFPVLLMEERNAKNVDSLIKGYLDLVTNGGASAYADYFAAEGKSGYSVSVQTYQKQEEKFVNINDPSMEYDAVKKVFQVIPGKNDSGYGQFTLLTVTFADPIALGKNYVLYLPIIVKLPVEITFQAAVLHDTVFLEKPFGETTTQVVAEYGARATARFAYNYEYGWGAVLMATASNPNGPMTNSFKKSVNLYAETATDSTILPAGTRLTLIDPQNGDESYSTTLTENKRSLDFAALFTDWKSAALSEMLDLVQVDVFSDKDEIWVEVTAEELPEDEEGRQQFLYYKDKYYRMAETTDTAVAKYKFECEEEYYLVMEFPENGTSICNVEFTLPENLNSEVTEKPTLPNIVEDISSENAKKLFIYQAISHSIAKIDESVCRYINDMEQPSVNVEAGFVALEATKNKIVLRMEDTIQGSLDYVNLLGENDKRFLQFSLNLEEYTADSKNDVKMKPDVLVEVAFYQDEWQIPIASYSMVVTGETHELILPVAQSSDGSNPVNLVQYMKEKQGQAKIQAKVSLTFFPDSSLSSFPTARLVNNLPEKYGRFSVSCILSEKESFLTGTRVRLDQGMAGYYRASDAYARLFFEADKLSELGINMKSPDEKELTESNITGAGYIDASGIQDFLSGDMLCTMKLYQKQNNGTYAQVNMGDYLTKASLNGVTSNELGESLTWRISRADSYGGCYDTEKQNFVIPASVSVKHDIGEAGVYANYRVELTVSFMDSNGEAVLTLNPDYFVYTFAKISTDLQR